MFKNLLIDFWSDIHTVKVWGQIAVILLCVLMSYLICRFLERRFPTATHHSESDQVAAQSLVSMRFPGLLLIFLFVGRLILLKWENEHLLSLLIPIVGSLVVIRFGIYLSRRIFTHDPSPGSLHFFLEKIFSTGVWLLVIFYYTGLLQDIWVFLNTHTLSIGANTFSLLTILQVVISVVVTVLLALWSSATLERRLMKVESLDTSLRIALSKLSRSLLILVAILISLDLVGIDLTVLSVFGGALGVGLGLGLQKVASNYVTGFIILFDKSLEVNDLITVDKYNGKINKITTRYTLLRGLDGVETIVPNEMLVSSPVQNASSSRQAILTSTNLTVPYYTDIKSLFPKLIQAVSKVEGIVSHLTPIVNLSNFGANGLELNVVFWIGKAEDKGAIIPRANRAIWDLLQEQNVRIAYPQVEIRQI